MKVKYKGNKHDGNKGKLIFISLVIVLTSITLLCLNVFSKDYYKVESREDKIKNIEFKDNADFQPYAWIRVQGTNIDYPVILNPERDYPVIQEQSYAWTGNYDTKFHNIMRIRGHNIFNLSTNPLLNSSNFERFEELMSFVYYDFVKENKYIQLSIGSDDYLYKIFSVAFIPNEVFANTSYANNYTKEEMQKLIDNLSKYNIYDFNVDVKNTDNVITLKTCTRFFGPTTDYEFTVAGRMVRKGEKVNNYNFKKAKNYEKIDKILKGDEMDNDKKSNDEM